MKWHRASPAVVALAFLALAPAATAQDARYGDESSVTLRVQGGGFSAIRELDELEMVDFEPGWSVGAGLGFQLNRHVALRANVALARAEILDRRAPITLQGNPALTGQQFNRIFYDADLQFRYPFDSGLSPYLLVGGGAVTIDHDRDGDLFDGDPGDDHFTKGAGKVGAGISYRVPNSGLELFVEGTGWIYNWDRNGFNRRQFDTTWDGGIAYRFGGR
jgi:hypothetical protein